MRLYGKDLREKRKACKIPQSTDRKVYRRLSWEWAREECTEGQDNQDGSPGPICHCGESKECVSARGLSASDLVPDPRLVSLLPNRAGLTVTLLHTHPVYNHTQYKPAVCGRCLACTSPPRSRYVARYWGDETPHMSLWRAVVLLKKKPNSR